jgi:hypothetical protein
MHLITADITHQMPHPWSVKQHPPLASMSKFQIDWLILFGGWARNRTEVRGFAGRCMLFF